MYIVDLNVLIYLSKHRVIRVDTSYIHFNCCISLLCFPVQCFHKADRSSLLLSDFECALIPSGVRVP